jgi:myo-inositol 2-dehydrogenase/D-chiro-inositol 1-dehydrogenase
METVRYGLIGSAFVSTIHAESIARVKGAAVAAVASPSQGKAAEFAVKHGIPNHFSDYRALLESPDIDAVVLGLPNDLHCEVTVAAAQVGKHVICEKPLCTTLDEADQMIAACKSAGVLLLYAEELLFAPKYVRAKQLVDDGALGDVFLIKQSEKHSGPHTPWFWDISRSGGGAMMDMGCHGVEYARWVLGRPKAKSVYAHLGNYVWKERTKGEDNSILIVEFEGGATAMIEDSWAKFGGMEDNTEIYGSKGSAYADLLRGNSILTYSQSGYGYAVEKADTTKGWTFTMFEELFNSGYPSEFEHFTACIKDGAMPRVTGEDGRVVLEVLFAGYEAAGTGKRVELPFVPPTGKKPADLWLRN